MTEDEIRRLLELKSEGPNLDYKAGFERNRANRDQKYELVRDLWPSPTYLSRLPTARGRSPGRHWTCPARPEPLNHRSMCRLGHYAVVLIECRVVKRGHHHLMNAFGPEQSTAMQMKASDLLGRKG